MLPTEGKLVVKKVLNGLMIILALMLVFAGFISYKIKDLVAIYFLVIGGVIFLFCNMYNVIINNKYKTTILIVTNQLVALVVMLLCFYLYSSFPTDLRAISIEQGMKLNSNLFWLKFAFLANSLLDAALRSKRFERKADEIEL